MSAARLRRRKARSAAFSVPASAALVLERCLFLAAKAPEQVGADGVEHVISVELELVDEDERCFRSLDLGYGDRAVERDDRSRREGQKLVVEPQDLAPVRGRRGRRVAVDCVDRRLDLIRAGLVPPQTSSDERLTLGDECTVPEASVLVGQQHEVALRGHARSATRLDEQHQREQA